MTRYERFVMAVVGAVALVTLARADAAESVLQEQDLTMDASIRSWVLKHDRISTSSWDQNRDGKPDAVQVYREVDGRPHLVEQWRDSDFDGEYDRLSIHNGGASWFGPGVKEIWQKTKGEKSSFLYLKRDDRKRLVTRATTSGFGSRVLKGIRTNPIPDIERRSDGSWTNHREGLRVYCDPNGVLSMVTSWTEGREIILANFARSAQRPQTVYVREWDPTTTESRRLKLFVYLRDRGFDGLYEYVQRERFENANREEISAWDNNCDGTFDRFRISSLDGSTRIEEDKDFDGLLDRVDSRAADGSTATLVGEQIPDRTLRTVDIPISDEEIKALLKRVKAGP